MAKITWFGEDELHEDHNGPRFNEWRVSAEEIIRFEVGKPAEVENAHVIAKARKNQFFRVEDDTPEQKPTLTLPKK